MTSPWPAGGPLTGNGLADGLRRLGLRRGDVVLVHASLSSLGFVVGGAATVVQTLLEALGPTGTLVVPAFTAGNCDPSRWALTYRGVPQEWWSLIRESLPAFDPAVTPSHNIGAVAETVRTWPGAVRSQHPQTSFAAVGANAAALTAGHHRDCHLGPDSPLGRLAALNAKILLLGVGYEVCSTFHLAEYLLPEVPQRDYECVIQVNGRRSWHHYRDVVLDDSDFGRLGGDLERAASGPPVSRARIGQALCRLLCLPQAVEYARSWMLAHRPRTP